MKEGVKLWEPSAAQIEGSNLHHYMDWLRRQNVISVNDYSDLWHWSVEDPEQFWQSLWQYFRILSDETPSRMLSSVTMTPDVTWFEGSSVNFAEHLLANERAGQPALYSLSEIREQQVMNWDELASKVRQVATWLREEGVTPGDRVACLMPVIPETVIAMLACMSIGAVWSNAAPEFGSQTVLDRFQQFGPSVIFVCDGYQFGGRRFERGEQTETIISGLQDTLQRVIYLPYLDETSALPAVPGDLQMTTWSELMQVTDPGPQSFRFTRVAHDHPLWVVYSSGTTGLPKAIVHSHVGTLLELKKFMTFHMDLSEKDVSFFYTTTGWVMFNLQVGMMLTGSAAVLYDGNPAWPHPGVLWEMASQVRATFFGASPGYVQLMQKEEVHPGKTYDLSNLRGVLVGGAPSTADTFQWFYQQVKSDLWVTSQSGGTELASALVGGVPTQAVYAGEIQARLLGMNVDSWSSDGQSLVEEVGELVVKTPFPSMPLCFLNDLDKQRYRQAYFEDFPNTWRHGDFIKINSRGGCYIYGRSDSTLNRHGVRFGTSEIYRVVESFDQVVDSLVVCLEMPDGGYFMPLFLQLAEGVALTDSLIEKLRKALKDQCSPRHVPDRFYEVAEVPYTLTGKKLEVPVRKLLQGVPKSQVVSEGAMKNPQSLNAFLALTTTEEEFRSVQRKVNDE